MRRRWISHYCIEKTLNRHAVRKFSDLKGERDSCQLARLSIEECDRYLNKYLRDIAEFIGAVANDCALLEGRQRVELAMKDG